MADHSDEVRHSVALADDHPVVRAGIRALLQGDPSLQVVAEYSDLPSVRRGLRQQQTDILLLDLSMEGGPALRVIPDLLAAQPGLKIIVLTMHDDAGFAREALRLGALAYVLKDAAAEELLLAVRSVLAGRTYLHPSIGARLALLDETPGGLTDREVEVLRLIAAGHTNAEIARLLFLSLRTVESHRGQIRTKLDLDSRADLIRWAQEHGLA
jgi:two-component system, NarL family, response regulator NreC